MKKQFNNAGLNLIEKFERSELSNLATIQGGAAAADTATIGENTASSSGDPDENSKDSDKAPAPIIIIAQ